MDKLMLKEHLVGILKVKYDNSEKIYDYKLNLNALLNSVGNFPEIIGDPNDPVELVIKNLIASIKKEIASEVNRNYLYCWVSPFGKSKRVRIHDFEVVPDNKINAPYIRSLNEITYFDFIISYKEGVLERGHAEELLSINGDSDIFDLYAKIGEQGLLEDGFWSKYPENSYEGFVRPGFGNKETQKNEKKKENADMAKFKINGFENVGEKVDIFGFSVLTQGVAVELKAGHFSTFDKLTGVITDVTGMVMEVPVPGFTIPVPISQLNIGDVIVDTPNTYVFVKEINGKIIETIDGEGVINTKSAVSQFGMADGFVAKVMNPLGDGGTNLFGGDNGGGMNPMMAMAMMGGKDSGGDNDMLGMMLMSQAMGGGNMFGAQPQPQIQPQIEAQAPVGIDAIGINNGANDFKDADLKNMIKKMLDEALSDLKKD